MIQLTEKEKKARELARAIRDLPILIDAVTKAYMHDGQAHSLPAVAAITGCPLATLRRVARELPNGWAPREVYVQFKASVTSSWNAAGYRCGPAEVWSPTVGHLRGIILAKEGLTP